MAQLDVPLPEITCENFERSWTRFEFVATAKQWEEAKQLSVLPTLLRGPLIDFYVTLTTEERADVKSLRDALAAKAGIKKDPLSCAKSFSARDQGSGESVDHFASALRKLFALAYPTEDPTSFVLLQRFMTGLQAPIRQHLLLQGAPTTLDAAVKQAVAIEYALDFAKTTEDSKEVNAVQTHSGGATSGGAESISQLQRTMEQLVQRLESLESQLASTTGARRAHNDPGTSPRYARRRGRCYLCGEEGHYRRECHLNFAEPARKASRGWQGQQ